VTELSNLLRMYICAVLQANGHCQHELTPELAPVQVVVVSGGGCYPVDLVTELGAGA
jgi:hypothetical protein